MPSKTSTSTHQQQAEKQYYLITDHSQESWKEPFTIDDADLVFDGKPLNMLYEENRWQAEHHVGVSGDHYRGESSRGRSRQSKK